MSVVYEWENEIAKQLEIPIKTSPLFPWKNRPRAVSSIRKHIPFADHIFGMLTTSAPALKFVLNTDEQSLSFNKKNIIPLIIDFYLRSGRETEMFLRSYNRCKVLLVSNREVYEKLARENHPLNLHHLALSLPDKWLVNEISRFEKRYDIVMAGRLNPVLENWTKQYIERHPDTTILHRQRNQDGFYYGGSDGMRYPAETRDDYMKILRLARVGLYSTPGIDGGESYTHGFNQVTPRFLELLSAGCHVLARYPENADTCWYDMESVTPALRSYDEFERQFDRARSVPIDADKYKKYLSRHVTSQRVQTLKEILSS